MPYMVARPDPEAPLYFSGYDQAGLGNIFEDVWNFAKNVVSAAVSHIKVETPSGQVVVDFSDPNWKEKLAASVGSIDFKLNVGGTSSNPVYTAIPQVAGAVSAAVGSIPSWVLWAALFGTGFLLLKPRLARQRT